MPRGAFPFRSLLWVLALGLAAACTPPGPQASTALSQPAGAPQPPPPLRKVDVCIPALSQAFAFLGIAQQRGYFAELGLDVTVQPMSGLTCTMAGVPGSVQFNVANVDQILQGDLPYRIVLVHEDRLRHQFVVGRNVHTYADLRGGRVAVSGLGGFTETMAREILLENGVNPDQDVVFIAIGTPDNRLAALLTGGVDASLVGVEEAVRAFDEGLRALPYTPRVMPVAPLTTTEQLLQSDHELVYRFVKGALMGRLFYGYRKAEALPLVLRFLNTEDMAQQEHVYGLLTQGWRELPALDEPEMRDAIDSARRQLKLDKTIATDRIFAPQFVRRAYEELKAANWEGLWSR